MKQALWKAYADPLPWAFYPGLVGSAIMANIIELGVSAGTVAGGLIVGLLGLLGYCGVRRVIIGHWR